MRWLIMGAGATGGYFGGLLARAGGDVTFVARGRHLEALQRDGLHVRTPDRDFTLPVRATGDPAAAGIADVILFAVKSYDTEPAAIAVQRNVGPQTAILCLQNGVDNEERLATRFGDERVLGGATRIEATMPEPGVVQRLSPFARLAFGAWAGPAGARERAILEVLRAAAIDASLHDDARRVIWDKFLFLSPLAAITAVTRAPIGEVLARAETRDLYRQAVAEAAAVAAARGVDLGGEAAVEGVLTTAAGLPPGMRTSMQRDLVAGRRIELDALCAVVVRYGRDAAVPTPAYAFVYAALLPAAHAAEGAAAL